MTTDTFNQSFAAFARDTVRPAIDGIPARKRRSLFAGLLTALAVFVVLAVAVYFILQPHREFLQKYSDISFWPIILLVPAALAIMAFSLIYILGLRAMVKEFQRTLLARMTEFIDPGLVHEARSPIAAETLADSLLFGGLGAPAAGADRFRGRSGDAVVELADIRVPVSPGGGGKEMLSGVFMKAVMDKAFLEPLFVFPQSAAASVSGLERGLAERGAAVQGGLVRIDDTVTLRQVVKPAGAAGWGDGLLPSGIGMTLADIRREDGTELYLCCRDRVLYAALLSRRGEFAAASDGFDFSNCRQFCRKGGAAMQLARELSRSGDIWRE